MKCPYPVYGWNAVRLSSNLTMDQLQELRLAVESDPKSKNPQHAAGKSIWIYAPAARKKLDAIAWAITYHLQQKRKSEAFNDFQQ
jgi:hypothetical protein